MSKPKIAVIVSSTRKTLTHFVDTPARRSNRDKGGEVITRHSTIQTPLLSQSLLAALGVTVVCPGASPSRVASPLVSLPPGMTTTGVMLATPGTELLSVTLMGAIAGW